MAEVFVARRVVGGVEKRLVIKRIRRERASDPRFVAMFVEEARLSMGLVHRNIVPVFDFGRAGDELFLAMELVDGPDLDAILRRARALDTRLAPMLAAYLALEACQALEHAHHATAPDGSPRPLVHRDVTPRNVLVSRAGEVKLVDFGVASSGLADGREAGAVRGTPAYMAPEQARGEGVDGRADLFSLGLVLWEALAGRRAYPGRSQAELLAQARAARVEALPAEVPEPLRRVVARATAEQVSERYDSARAMQLALDEYLVAARAAANSPPPSHLLAAWLAEHLPPEPLPSAEIAIPDGPVLTFLDDGADSVVGDERATFRSLAETVAESQPGHADESPADDNAEPGEDADGDGDGDGAAEDGARGPRLWAAVAALLVAAVAASAALLSGESVTPETTTDTTTDKPSQAGEHAPPSEPSQGAGARAVAEGVHMSEIDRDAAAESAEQAASEPAAAEPAPVQASRERPRERPATRRERPSQPAAPAPSPRAPASALGTVKISVTPWARVSVLGSSAGCAETPCVLELPAGTHTLRLLNPVAGVRKDRVIELAAGESLIVRETLSP